MFRAILFFITIIYAFNSHAVEVKGLYQFSIEVDSQSRIIRQKALKSALRGVVVKVGGDERILTHDIFKKAFINASAYVTQYRYEYNKKSLMLIASFEKVKVNKLFQQAGFPLWGTLRPQVLLWLITEEGLSRTIISSSTVSSLTDMVNQFSIERGLPILMPLMDLTDNTQLQISDIWGRFEQPIRTVSSRYQAEAIIVMRISHANLVTSDDISNDTLDCGLLCQQIETTKLSYTLDWSLITKRQKFSQQYTGISQGSLVTQGLSDITDIIYQHYALSTSTKNQYVIDVVNIDSLSSYTRVFDFLVDLSAVQSVQLVSAKGSIRRFNLTLLGSEDTFLASLKLNKQLKQFIDPLAAFDQSDENDAAVFYWEQ